SVFCMQGMWSNERGQPVLVHWGAITGLPDRPRIGDFTSSLEAAGIRAGTVNPGTDPGSLTGWQSLVSAAAEAERQHLDELAAQHAEAHRPRIAEFSERLDRWAGAREQQLALHASADPRRRKEEQRITAVRDETQNLIRSLSPAGQPLIRVIAVFVPETR